MERWWCLDCRVSVDLNRQGRCQLCDSDAVDSMERTGMYKTASSIFTPMAECSESLTVHLETTLVWESEAAVPTAVEEPVLKY